MVIAMKKDCIIPPGSEPSLCYSPAIRYGDTIYVAGQGGEDASGYIPADIEGQTELAIQNARKLLEAAGSSLDQVLMCQCFLRREADFSGMNAAYAKFFGGEHNTAPARYTIIAPPVDEKYLVEIAMIAGV